MSQKLESSQYTGRMLNDRYLLAAPFAVGPLNWMFRALDISLNREVAIKMLRPHTLDDVDFLGRFKYHAQLAAQLNQANIASIYDWDVDELPYLVTELCKGGNLKSMLVEIKDNASHSKKRLPYLTPRQVISIGTQAAGALAYAHQQGMSHKDLSPFNVLFDARGSVKLSDFGIAPMFKKKAPPGVAESLLGASYYSAPEQLIDEAHLTEKADIYALALVLVEAATGELPFADDTNMGSYITRMTESLAAPESLGEFGEVLNLALKLDPGQRPSATELIWYMEGLPDYKPVVSLPARSHPEKMPEAAAVDWNRLKSSDNFKSQLKSQHKKAEPKKVKPAMLEKQQKQPQPALKTKTVRKSAVFTLALASILVLAGAVFSLTAFINWFNGSGDPKVPDLVGTSDLTQLEKSWQVQQFSLRQVGIPIGEIISLDPPPGESLKKGSVLRVTISRGEPLIRIPTNLLGGTLEETEQRLSGLGLRLGEATLIEGSSRIPLTISPNGEVRRGAAAAGRTSDYLVIGFDEPTGELLRGSEVSLLVSRISG